MWQKSVNRIKETDVDTNKATIATLSFSMNAPKFTSKCSHVFYINMFEKCEKVIAEGHFRSLLKCTIAIEVSTRSHPKTKLS